MTQDEIIRMAREAGIEADECNGYLEWWNFAKLVAAHEREKQAEQEPVAWQGAEEWEPLAFQLCADENGEESCNELLWDGGVIPEPWGERWLKYEDEAKRMIEYVRKYAAPVRTKDLTDDEIRAMFNGYVAPEILLMFRAVIAADRRRIMPTNILDNESYLEALQRRYVEESKNEENMKLIQMAEESCSLNQTLNTDLEFLKRFSALVAEPWIETNKALAKEIIELRNQYLDKLAEAIDLSVKAEREACAKVCEKRSHRSDDMGAICAAAIRARGEK